MCSSCSSGCFGSVALPCRSWGAAGELLPHAPALGRGHLALSHPPALTPAPTGSPGRGLSFGGTWSRGWGHLVATKSDQNQTPKNKNTHHHGTLDLSRFGLVKTRGAPGQARPGHGGTWSRHNSRPQPTTHQDRRALVHRLAQKKFRGSLRSPLEVADNGMSLPQEGRVPPYTRVCRACGWVLGWGQASLTLRLPPPARYSRRPVDNL